VNDFWKEFKAGLTLTPDEVGYVRELLTSKGWQVLTHKVFPKQELDLLSTSKSLGGEATEKGSFIAGQYAGFKLSQELAEKAGQPKKEQPAPQRERGEVHRRGLAGSKPLS